MPFKSEKQRGYMNANKDKIGAGVVEEFNKASKGKKLPAKVKAKKSSIQVANEVASKFPKSK